MFDHLELGGEVSIAELVRADQHHPLGLAFMPLLMRVKSAPGCARMRTTFKNAGS